MPIHPDPLMYHVNYNLDVENTNIVVDRRAVEVLRECIELMRKKGAAYNRIPQAEYYPNGLSDIWTMMHQKMTRMRSLLAEPGENDFESLEDSARDLINYAAFFIEFSEGKMDGQ